jgi:hypothetical protein
LHTVFVDQLMLPDDVTVIPSEPGSPEASGQRWKTLGTFTVTGNTLSVTLSDDDRADGIDDPSRGAFVVAGRVRLVPVADANGARIISRHDAGYSETASVLFGTPLTPGATMDLDRRALPADLRAAFASAGKPLDARAAVVVLIPPAVARRRHHQDRPGHVGQDHVRLPVHAAR